MDRDDERPIDLGSTDVLDFGGPDDERPPGGSRWFTVLIAVVVVVGIAFVVLNHHHKTTTTKTTRQTVPTPGTIPLGPLHGITSFAPVVTKGPPILGITAGYDIFARGANSVIRIEPATGRVTVTPVQSLLSTGAVSFVATSNWALVRPFDPVPAFFIQDGKEASLLDWASDADGGLVFPGPNSTHVWSETAGTEVTMELVGADGKPTGPSIAIPSTGGTNIFPDGTGYLVLTDVGGEILLARPGHNQLLASGGLLAIGTKQLLIQACPVELQCAVSLVDRATGVKHPLSGYHLPSNGTVGVISPDGGTAAVYSDNPNGVAEVHLVDLSNGVDQTVDAQIDPGASIAPVAWSPDGKWLFVADRSGRLKAINPVDGSVHIIDAKLPDVTQLTIRPAP